MSSVLSRLQWHSPPTRWSLDAKQDVLTVHTDAGTDFWQRTHYGFQVDNGHFFHLRTAGDFVLTARVVGRGLHQYDQAGLMVRLSADCWIKTSVEFEPGGPNRLGAVVTRDGWSDWSTQPLDAAVDTVWFRLRTEGADCIAETSFDGTAWTQIRMAHLHASGPEAEVQCGVYACSPKAAGYEADFHDVTWRKGRLEG